MYTIIRHSIMFLFCCSLSMVGVQVLLDVASEIIILLAHIRALPVMSASVAGR